MRNFFPSSQTQSHGLSDPELPNLSRSSTLVSSEQDDNFDLEKNFHDSFLRKYTPKYPNDNKTREDVKVSQTPSLCLESETRSGPRVSHLLVSWWLWEIFSWTISAICFSAIGLILCLYDNQVVPARWPLGITLNAYISVLSAIAKYSLAVPVDEALGQLRWLYFAKTGETRKLIDFERFDDATRGPWGALALLLYTKARCVSTFNF
jgi:hypothetical protein